MDPIKELEARLKEMVKSRKAFAKHVDRAALKEYVSILISDCRSVAEALSEVTTATMGAAIKKNIESSKGNAVKAYNAYLTQLKRNPNKTAFQMETKIPFSSLEDACKRRAIVLTELESNIDELFKHNTINIFNSRLSHVVVLGILSEAKMLTKYSKYMLSAIVSEITNQRDIAKYRYVWMSDYNVDVSNLVSRSLASKNGTNFEAIIKDLQTKAVDVSLIDDFNQVTLDMVNTTKVSKDAKDIIKSGVKGIGIFRWIGEILETRKQEKIEQKRREIEWMRAHVELLRMKLEDVSEDSPEYQRLVKIIERYEEMITKADKQDQKEKQ